MSSTTTNKAVIDHARKWLGTPYHHQASTPGIGTDCLGLIRGIWRQLYGCEAENIPNYPKHMPLNEGELLYEAAARYMEEIALSEIVAGNLLLFRMKPEHPMRHAAILSSPSHLIHACAYREVMEVRFSRYWKEKAACAFRFPLREGESHE
ncbi:MAG: NlpC/P60 family protein [Parvibaculales bacterium]